MSVVLWSEEEEADGSCICHSELILTQTDVQHVSGKHINVRVEQIF